MAYFPNGTAGEAYEAQYCSRCIHGDNYRGDDKGCPVMLAHVLYAYDLCNEDAAKNPGKHMLDILIPEDEESFPDRCSMFIDAQALGIKRPEPAYSGPPIPDTPYGWMLKLCNHDRPWIARPFALHHAGLDWACATDGVMALLVEGVTEWAAPESDAFLRQLRGFFTGASVRAQRVSFEALLVWAREPLAANEHNAKPGRLLGHVVDRARLARLLEHVTATDVLIRSRKSTEDPVVLEAETWMAALMKMKSDPIGEPFELAKGTE